MYETIAIRGNLSAGIETLVQLKKLGASPKLESIGSNFVIKVPSAEVDKFKYLFPCGAYR